MEVQFRRGDRFTPTVEFDKIEAIEGLEGAGDGEGRTERKKVLRSQDE